MPSPIELILDPISLSILGMFALLLVWERAFPARELPQVRGWNVRALGVFATVFLLSSYLPLLTDGFLARYQLFDLTGLGDYWGAAAGMLVYELGAYWWHRSLHSSDTLWKLAHQMHHSAERIDTLGAFYLSPLGIAGFTLVQSLALVLVVGLTPTAATIAVLAINFCAIFQHANIRTPRWLGYIIQRPEAHSVHHQRGHHRDNYADLPVLDLLFGTFNNPEEFHGETGFYPGASARVLDMALCRDVSEPRVVGASFEPTEPEAEWIRGKGFYILN